MHEARDALAQAACQLEGIQVEARTKTKDSESDRSWTFSEWIARKRSSGTRGRRRAVSRAAEDQGGGLCWKRRFEWIERTEYSPDLYGGAAGIGLFLAELARETGEERYADAARGAAPWVAGPIWGRGRTQHGFHSGEAGVAFFFLRLAELLDQPGYLAAADLRLRRLRGAIPVTIDLMYGTAGTVLGLLAMHAVTGSSEFLADARTLGNQLVESALTTEAGAGYYWEIASSAPGGPVTSHLGLLHGGAGIGLALACLGRVTGEEHYFETARGAAELLIALGVPSPSNTSIECEHEVARLAWAPGWSCKGLQAHCHGAGGIGQFLLWLDGLRPDPRYRAAAKSAGSTAAARRTIETCTSVCHGVSGTGHFMLDCHQKLGGGRWLTFARECGSNLQRLGFPSDRACTQCTTREQSRRT